jgi:hypothetical protein
MKQFERLKQKTSFSVFLVKPNYSHSTESLVEDYFFFLQDMQFSINLGYLPLTFCISAMMFVGPLLAKTLSIFRLQEDDNIDSKSINRGLTGIVYVCFSAYKFLSETTVPSSRKVSESEP